VHICVLYNCDLLILCSVEFRCLNIEFFVLFQTVTTLFLIPSPGLQSITLAPCFLCFQFCDVAEVMIIHIKDVLANSGYEQNIKMREFKHPSTFFATLLEPNRESGDFVNFVNLFSKLGNLIFIFKIFFCCHFEIKDFQLYGRKCIKL
jgi:hypothetical protein